MAPLKKIIGMLRLTRPANLVTAAADVLAGVAIAGFVAGTDLYTAFPKELSLLIVATMALYAGGVVFNDVLDAPLDIIERPERPIPSGLVKKRQAAILASALLLIGIIAAAFVNLYAFLLAFAIAVAAVVYDAWGKHQDWLGPVNMGLCRGLNLMLGVSILPIALWQNAMLAFTPVLYIAAITAISRGEVHGGSKNILSMAVGLYAIVVVSIAFKAFQNGTFLFADFFLLLFSILIFPPLFKAMNDPQAKKIGKAVKAGVLSLIVMNAAWAAAFGAPGMAFIILLLLPLSMLLAKAFAVT